MPVSGASVTSPLLGASSIFTDVRSNWPTGSASFRSTLISIARLCVGAGKSTLAKALERRLFSRDGSPILLDGDTLRAGLNGDLGFSAEDRTENIRRLAEIATHLARNGHIAIVAAVSPSREDRAAARRIAGECFHEICVATPAHICEQRDPKGHYAKARRGELPSFTGISNDYEPPVSCELSVDTSAQPVARTIEVIEEFLLRSGLVAPKPNY